MKKFRFAQENEISKIMKRGTKRTMTKREAFAKLFNLDVSKIGEMEPIEQDNKKRRIEKPVNKE